MRLKLIEFPNKNRVLLPGLIFEPESASDAILISLHGNGSSGGMYNVEKNNALSKFLTDRGISFLTFSNTGAHLLQKFDVVNNGIRERGNFGVAYELIKDCLNDIDGAIDYVHNLGYKTIYLLGQSTGANKICVYDKYKKNNPIKAYILTSGGDDSGIFYKSVGKSRFNMVFNHCHNAIKSGKGRDLIPNHLAPMIISYASLYDQIDPNGDYNTFPFYWVSEKIEVMQKEPFHEFRSITKPCLVIYGEEDEYCHKGADKCLNILKEISKDKNNYQFQLIQKADHSFSNKEGELSKIISSWIDKQP